MCRTASSRCDWDLVLDPAPFHIHLHLWDKKAAQAGGQPAKGRYLNDVCTGNWEGVPKSREKEVRLRDFDIDKREGQQIVLFCNFADVI